MRVTIPCMRTDPERQDTTDALVTVADDEDGDVTIDLRDAEDDGEIYADGDRFRVSINVVALLRAISAAGIDVASAVVDAGKKV